MKIRCKNCFKVLEPKEEYCTYCGEHSEQIKKAMITGDYGPSLLQQFKISLTIFLIIAFIGSGIVMTIFAMFTKDATQSLFNRSNAMLVTSIIMGVITIIINRKNLKDALWNGNQQQLLGATLIATIFIVIVVLLSLLSKVTRIVPTYITDYLSSGDARWFSGKQTNISLIFISFVLIIITEEIIFRRLLIDAFDDETLLGNTVIIILSGIIGTALDFAWIMAPETIIVSLLTNILASAIYAYTNRSLGINIVMRVLVLICEILIFLV